MELCLVCSMVQQKLLGMVSAKCVEFSLGLAHSSCLAKFFALSPDFDHAACFEPNCLASLACVFVGTRQVVFSPFTSIGENVHRLRGSRSNGKPISSIAVKQWLASATPADVAVDDVRRAMNIDRLREMLRERPGAFARERKHHIYNQI